mmetsp:Transcript_44509/g.100626  ORF Transcript_44509/g.100626 Transcript_44509/m.100626 type:complete len:479 (-) Transcript_44509:20-1456(-)
MVSIMALALASLLLSVGRCMRVGRDSEDSQDGDCSWAKLDTSSGWQCKTIKSFTGGMQGNTKLVQLSPPDGRAPFKAVLKEMNSNQNPMGLHSLENERKIAELLTEKGFSDMPAYFLDLAVEPRYTKYKNAASMTLAEKDACDNKRSNTGICQINEAWDACNGHRGNIDTLTEIPRSQMKKKGLACPDTQVLAMEFLEGYKDLKGLQSQLQGESGFIREVRAAALFVAYDEMKKRGISHCDFNPGNAMFKLDDPSDAKIIDFGLARMNDHPVGACRGNLEDTGRPGFLWLSLYRGQRDEIEFAQNDRKAGPLALSRNAAFQTPSGEIMQPFSTMRGKFMGKGGTQPWNKETRQNWPGIVAYAYKLLQEFQAQAPTPDASSDVDVVVHPQRANSMHPMPTTTTTTTTATTARERGALACSRVYADRGSGCKLALYDKSRCTVRLQCITGKIISKEVGKEDASFGGRIEIDDCRACRVLR